MSMLLAGIVALSGAITGWVRYVARKHGMMDLPNTRSSHSIPTPRGGGLAIVLSSMIGIATLAFLGVIDLRLALALLIGGVPVAVVGFLDDRSSVSVRLRLGLHFGAAIAAVAILGGMPPLQAGAEPVDLGLFGDVLAVIAIVWVLNLFNFMDGIDGLAASQSVFMATAGAAIAVWVGGSASVGAAASVLAAASFGFLLWNWPPARIFMGDVGSGYVGYMLAVLALGAARESPVAIAVWLIAGGLFFVDATTTLVRRMLRGDRASVAHRSHAYQWLARRWGSHLRVTSLAIAINVLWLLPCAIWAARRPEAAAWIVALALFPVLVGAIIAGAGRSETSGH